MDFVTSKEDEIQKQKELTKSLNFGIKALETLSKINPQVFFLKNY